MLEVRNGFFCPCINLPLLRLTPKQEARSLLFQFSAKYSKLISCLLLLNIFSLPARTVILSRLRPETLVHHAAERIYFHAFCNITSHQLCHVPLLPLLVTRPPPRRRKNILPRSCIAISIANKKQAGKLFPSLLLFYILILPIVSPKTKLVALHRYYASPNYQQLSLYHRWQNILLCLCNTALSSSSHIHHTLSAPSPLIS